MNFNEAMQMLGSKLQGKYGHLGFKYKKSDKTLTRHSKNFTYMIAFSSFGGNTKDSISIEVCYIINTRPYDPYGYAKPDINTQPLFYSLRDNEIYLDIGNEEKIDNAFEIVCQWMDQLLIPKMNIIVHFSVSEGAGIDAHGPVIGVQDQPALGKGKIHLPHHKGVVNRGQQLAAAGIPQLYGGAATILLNGHQAAPCPHHAGIRKT